ncbi:MAG: DUF359 domain-containing protein [Methanosphaera sp.]|nr:DUF359 domain-containing protein [Methanosphaera sp.]
MLKLPYSLREELKEPLGQLHKSIDSIEDLLLQQLSHDKLIITIGDVTTENLLNKGIIPQIGIVDNMTRRKPVDINLDKIDNFKYVSNPAGTITDELNDIIIDSISMATVDNPVIIDVDGEEDLAVLPCVINAPKDTLILYGQPREGVVLVCVDEAYDQALNYYNKLIKE